MLEEGIKGSPYQVEPYRPTLENTFRLHDRQRTGELLLKASEVGDRQDKTLFTLSNPHLDDERYEDAIQVINQMEETVNPCAEWNLVRVYNKLRDFVVAVIRYEQAYHELSHEPDSLKEYVFFLREEGQPRRTQELLTYYLILKPGDVEALPLLGGLTER